MLSVVAAKCSAPPSGKSSLVGDVMTTYCMLSIFTALLYCSALWVRRNGLGDRRNPTKSAISRASVPKYHKGNMSVAETLIDIGANCAAYGIDISSLSIFLICSLLLLKVNRFLIFSGILCCIKYINIKEKGVKYGRIVLNIQRRTGWLNQING